MLWLLAGKMGLELQRKAAGMVGAEHLPEELQEFGMESPEPLDAAGLSRRHDDVQAFINPIFSRYVSKNRRVKPQTIQKRARGRPRKAPDAPIRRQGPHQAYWEEEYEEEEQERRAYDIYSSRKDPGGRVDAPYKLRAAPTLGKKSPWVLRNLPLDDPPPLPRWGTKRHRTGWESLSHMHYSGPGELLARLAPQSRQGGNVNMLSPAAPVTMAAHAHNMPHGAISVPESGMPSPSAPKFDTQDMRNLLSSAFDSIVTEISKQAVLALGSSSGHRSRDPRLRTFQEGSASPM